MPSTTKRPSPYLTAAIMLLGACAFGALLSMLPHDPFARFRLLKNVGLLAVVGAFFFFEGLLAVVGAFFFFEWWDQNHEGPYRVNSQQKTYAERLWQARIRLSAALVELRQAADAVDQSNIKRAVYQTEKSLEVVGRRIKRLHRELQQRKKNQNVDDRKPKPQTGEATPANRG